jgi:hypothetical protein
VGALTGVLFGAAHVDQGLAQVRQHVLLEGSNLLIIAFHNGIGRRGRGGHFFGERKSLSYPGIPAPIEQADVLMAKQSKHPQCVGSPPVTFIAVDDDSVIPSYPFAGHKLGKALAIDVISHNRVIEFRVPVNFQGTRDVTRVIEKHVLVGFEDHEAVSAGVLLEPLGGDKTLGVSVTSEFG